MRKLTYDEVKEVFESKGNQLISTTYEGNKIPLEYICDCGKVDKKTINAFKNGSRCKKCGDKKTANGLRMKLEDLKQLLTNENCELIGEYENAQIPFKFKCSCGEEGKIRLADFKKGARCKKCSIKKRVETKQKNNNYAKQYQVLFENEGYKMLSPYVKAAERVEVECPKGHKVKITPANFKTGYRCGECSPSKKKTYKEVLEFFESENFKLISKEYKEAFTILQAICPKGHEIEITWDNFRAGKRCKDCWLENNVGENHQRWNANLTDEEREKKRNIEGYPEWRKAVYERDNYSCVCCEKKGGKLNAHHLNGYDKFKEERLVLENGVTLCNECHLDFHNLYGRGNNTKEQFKEYVKSKYKEKTLA